MHHTLTGQDVRLAAVRHAWLLLSLIATDATEWDDLHAAARITHR